MAAKKKAAVKKSAAEKDSEARAEVAEDLRTQQEEAAAGQTDAQQEMREYHEGYFQTNDPITGEERDLDEKPRAARIDRGETVEDVIREQQK